MANYKNKISYIGERRNNSLDPEEPSVGDERFTKCESCGYQKDCTYGPDPFAEEIYGDSNPMWQCTDCHNNSCDDI
jgi:hypothetical protein